MIQVMLKDALSLVIDHRGKTPKKLGGDWSESGHRVISALNMKESRVDNNAHHFVSDELFEKWMPNTLKKGDVLLTSEAPLGEVAFLDSICDWAIGQRVIGLRANPEVLNGQYLYYLLRGGNPRQELFARATGTTVLGIRQAELLKIQLELPDVDTQTKIADALGSIDKKIESNWNKSLIAQELLNNLYQKWFIQFTPWGGHRPDDWVPGKLSDVLDRVVETVKKDQFPNLPYVPIDSIPMNSLGLEKFRPNDEAQSSLCHFDKNDILIGAMRVYFHRVALAPFEGITRNTTFVLRPKNRSLLSFTLLLCNLDSTIDYAQSTSKGSTMPYAVWEEGMAEMPIYIPTQSVLEEFSSLCSPFVELIRDLIFENQRLESTLQQLMPGLLSIPQRIAGYDSEV